VSVPFPVTIGTRNIRIMDPDAANAAAADNERYDDATGVIAFRITPIPDPALLAKAIIVGWSTTASDLAAVNTAMANVATDIGTPSGSPQASLVANVAVIVPPILAMGSAAGKGGGPWMGGGLDWIGWDGENRIKTIAVRSVGADYATGVVLELVT
jgi:hypothetical protein